MDHIQAVEGMAAERYLLDELTPEVRDAFEEHVFDCPECAMDLRAATAFVEEAKAQLPTLTRPLPTPPSTGTVRPKVRWNGWFMGLRPAFAVPAFATLLLVVGYQNLVTLPVLRTEANQPRLLPWTPIHEATRGGAGTAISADRKHGVALPVDIVPQPGMAASSSYSFDLLDSRGKLVWTGAIAAPPVSDGGEQRITLALPGAMLRGGSYTVAVSGVGAHGERTPVERFVFAVHLAD